MPLHHSLLKTALFLNKAFYATRTRKWAVEQRCGKKSSSGWSVALHRHSASLLRGLGIVFYVYFHPFSVVSTIRILADRIRLSADAISALTDSLMLLTHSLISLPFERAKRIEHLISHWISFYSRRHKVRISLTTTKPSFRLFCILSLISTNCLCASHSSCCAPPLFRVAYFSLCQPNRNKEKPLYLQSSLISIQFTIYEAFVYTGPYGIGEFVREPCSGTSSNHVDAYGVHSNG